MLELQTISALIVIYFLSLFSCYATMKAKCRVLCDVTYYTYNISEICIINDVCQKTKSKPFQANIVFPSKGPQFYRNNYRPHKIELSQAKPVPIPKRVSNETRLRKIPNTLNEKDDGIASYKKDPEWKKQINQLKTVDYLNMDSVFSGHTDDATINLPRLEVHGKVRYFPWEDDVNYNEVCRKVLSRISKNDTYYIISGSINGGIGHKYLSIFYSVTYAILLRRRFLIHMRDAFWNETSSCIRSLRYEGGYRGLIACNRTHPCVSSYATSTVDELPKANLLMLDLRLQNIYTDRNLERLRSFGILGPEEGWDAYRKKMMRLLLNPSRSNIAMIEKEWKKLKVPKVDLSIHIRCGGQLSDHPEATVMVSPEQLERMPSLIREVIVNQSMPLASPNFPMQHNSVVYLSTDSSKAEARLRSELTEMKVLTVSSLQRGHTVFAGTASLQRAMMDLFLLCKSDTFLATQGSGFSQIARMLCMPSHTVWIPVNKTHSVLSVF